MSLAQIRDEFRIPARLGARVSVRSPHGFLHGTITGSDEELVIVTLERNGQPIAFYPTQLTFR